MSFAALSSRSRARAVLDERAQLVDGLSSLYFSTVDVGRRRPVNFEAVGEVDIPLQRSLRLARSERTGQEGSVYAYISKDFEKMVLPLDWPLVNQAPMEVPESVLALCRQGDQRSLAANGMPARGTVSVDQSNFTLAFRREPMQTPAVSSAGAALVITENDDDHRGLFAPEARCAELEVPVIQ